MDSVYISVIGDKIHYQFGVDGSITVPVLDVETSQRMESRSTDQFTHFRCVKNKISCLLHV